ncbi:peptidase S8 and S53 subtilisin kexin sedolisin [Xanthobacter versatilis]|uniref:Peptidase S8 and S53 subtilisin kexin sedolisin n=1 Tax=Xanthobacter autotrophicus (strain ATCC BAA-1158 / Py2) TaxID=78245 RepID=A7IE74_XANP2|nr:peptidase S8 and S53 subtilisin kexin sedolisin [Xanthobacter autotrophicus Py2]
MARLLVKVRGDGRAFAQGFRASGLEVQPILTIPASAAGSALAEQDLARQDQSTWLKLVDRASSDNLWDDAHAMLNGASSFAAVSPAQIEAVEPDISQAWPWDRPSDGGKGAGLRGAAAQADVCAFDDQDGSGGKACVPRRPAWNLDDDFSRLRRARDTVGAAQTKIRIAHLDTGYDPGHATLPRNLLTSLQANFVAGEDPADAVDRIPPGESLFSNRGHGTGTLSLLAGNLIDKPPGFPRFSDFLGGAPLAEIIPIRIADWVVRFTTGTIVQGIEHARRNGAHVLSMSMGGVTSQALTDAVNLAYDTGMVLVTAGGNNFAGWPTPKTIVYPARLRRVIAACGVMGDGRAYSGLSSGTMQGNYGPREKMDTAIGAYTPNVPWAQIGCGTIVDMDGGGTSAATPQVAAAAALWLAHHWDVVKAYPQAWMRVEAVRLALFGSAAKSTPRMDAAETFEKIGQGVLNGEAALAIAPARAGDLRKLPPSEPSWPWLSLIFGEGGVELAAGADRRRRTMLALELTQMAQRVAAVEEAIPSPERPPNEIGFAERARYLEAALDAGDPSQALRAELERHLDRSVVPASSVAPAKPYQVRRKIIEPGAPPRRLRVYALDPGMSKRLDTLPVNETVLTLPWDDHPEAGARTPGPLRPGPVGDYLEVVDVDPASGKAYEPVDLNDPWLLAQSGLEPSEGNPKFHQQMVYAVGMKTIGAFEKALGRRALWAPHQPRKADGTYGDAIPMRRLRIYPHALRARNAYYSPTKVALLFGYFPANSTQNDATAPGSMVFSCLSSDIISHEMSHALLDGLHRRFQENSNPDVAAFHEGFADIVAIFQHFTIPELVRFEIGRARGRLDAATLLAGLAAQFGEGSGIGGALRNYLSNTTRARRYASTTESHDRGEILVLAAYDAFLAIVQRRTADLIRIATGGTGILPSGALHPDLVERLTEETCKAAEHVLRMCIRALDYCPAVDITFEEYLRAIITADVDLVPDDPYGYRVAFMEAFRARGIPMRSVRSVSVESLTWNTPETNNPPRVAKAFAQIDFDLERHASHEEIVAVNERNRWTLWRTLDEAFAADPDACRDFGLLPDMPRYDAQGKEREKVAGRAKSTTTFDVFSVRPAQRIGPDGSLQRTIVAVVHQRRPIAFDEKDVANGFFWFRSGATLILDANGGKPEIRYIVLKTGDSERRQQVQRSTQGANHLSPLRALYFSGMAREPFAMMHADRGEHDHG